MEPPTSASLQIELQRLIDQATDLSGMNQLSRTFLRLLHEEQDPGNQRTIKEAILTLAQKAVDAKKALEQREAAQDVPDVVCQAIFSVRDVKVHRISGGTSEQLELADMHIVLVSTEHGHEMAFIEVGSFHYPLTPAIPCLRSLGGSYILPLQDEVFYGVSLPDGIPDAYITALDRLLTALSDFRVESTSPVAAQQALDPSSTPTQTVVADRIAASLEVGAERLASGIENTTALLAAGIEASQGFLQNRIKPLEEPMSVNPFVSLALRGVASGSGYVVAVKPIVIEKFVSIARFIGRQTMALIPSRSSGDGTNAGGSSSPAASAAVKVGGAALLSATRVWDSLSKAGQLLVATTGKSAAKLVHHRYGAEAGAAAENAVVAVRNTLEVYNTRPSQILSSVAVAGGKATVKDFIQSQKQQRELEKESKHG